MSNDRPRPSWALWVGSTLVFVVALNWLWAWAGVPYLARLVLGLVLGLIVGLELARYERRRRRP